MTKEIRVAPPNSIVLVMDLVPGIVVPESMGGRRVAATPSCVAVGTLCSVDGETTITLSDEEVPVLPGESLVFDGMLDTPGKRLAICSVLDEPLLVLDVGSLQTRVRIWANGDHEPDVIHVVAG